MSGELVVLATAIGVLAVALASAVAVAWWLWEAGMQ